MCEKFSSWGLFLKKQKREKKIEKEKRELFDNHQRKVCNGGMKREKESEFELFEKSCYKIALLTFRHLCLSRKTKIHLEPSHITT
jgi:hypothetical protein